jgi:hypothetical protein
VVIQGAGGLGIYGGRRGRHRHGRLPRHRHRRHLQPSGVGRAMRRG